MSVRRKFMRNAFMAACAAALGLSVSVTAQAATPKNMLVISKSADPQMLDIAVTMDNNDWSITYPSYQRLIKYKAEGSTEVEGELAKSWATSADKLTWTFTLNEGQKFSDGAPVDAQAVKYSFDRLMKMKQGPSEPFPAGLQVTVKDPMTVEFKLDKPFAPFLNILANNGAGIINPAVEKQAGGADKYLAGHTAGSGPYQLAKWNKGRSLILERNPHYGGQQPTLEKVAFKIVPEASARRLQLQNGDLDIVGSIQPDQVKAMQDASGVVFKKVPSLLVSYLYLNNKTGPLSNVALRKGIAQAVDYNGMINGIMHGEAKPLNGPIPEGMWAHDETLPGVKTDLAAAKESVGEAAPDKPLTLLYSTKEPYWEPI
ncbi:MAG: ABC transporter substrate-binding protein, partial [Advenella sp.]